MRTNSVMNTDSNSQPSLEISLKSKTSNRPIFIFGCPRSGTSLLSRILNCHPRIAIPFESHLYNTFYPWLKYYGNLDKKQNRERLVKDILSTEVIRDWVPRPDFYQTLNAIKQYNFQGIVNAFMQTWATDQGKERWGEKTPAHLFYWREILEAFPNLQVIHIVRDGRDVSLSWKRSRFGPKHVYPLAKKWIHYLETVDKFKSVLAQDTFIETRYEDLVLNPTHEIQRICHFLGEEFMPEMLNFHTKHISYPTDEKNQKNLSQPLLKENINKWQHDITARELRIFESVAGDFLDYYGYDRKLYRPQLPNLERVWIQYIEHPPRKVLSMIRNGKGHIDAIRRLKIHLGLKMSSFTNTE